MLRSTLAAVALMSAVQAAPAFAADMGDQSEPIKLAVNEWTGQHISTYIAGETLKEAGYTVEYITAGYDAQFTALADGQLHATMEVWTSNAPDLWIQMSEAGKVEDIGDTGIEAREGFIYPLHVKELCPGLPAWEALVECAEAFATAETFPNGRLIDYPAEWGTPGADRLIGLELPYSAVPAGSEGALIAELKASIVKKSPLLMVFWQPHWALAEYETEWVALPAAEDACFSDPAWGVNPSAVNDCDFATSRVFKVAWSGLKDKWPAAHTILQAVSIPTADQQAMMGAIDNGGEDLQKVIDEWMDANRSTWQAWIDAGV